MSYADFETSQNAGTRIKLFIVQASPTAIWRYTNQPVTVVYADDFYYPVAGIDHDTIPNDPLNVDSARVTLKLPANHEICNLFKLGSPGSDLTLKILHGNGSGQYVVKWDGRLVDFQLRPPYGNLVSESVYTKSRRMTNGLLVSTTCPVDLYGPLCKVNKNAFKVTATITSISGLSVVCTAIDAKPDKWFLGGLINWQHPDFTDIQMRAGVIGHTGDTLKLSRPQPTLNVGAVIDVYPGCDHFYAQDCKAKFNNTANFKGIPLINGNDPTKGYRAW